MYLLTRKFCHLENSIFYSFALVRLHFRFHKYSLFVEKTNIVNALSIPSYEFNQIWTFDQNFMSGAGLTALNLNNSEDNDVTRDVWEIQGTLHSSSKGFLRRILLYFIAEVLSMLYIDGDKISRRSG